MRGGGPSLRKTNNIYRAYGVRLFQPRRLISKLKLKVNVVHRLIAMITTSRMQTAFRTCGVRCANQLEQPGLRMEFSGKVRVVPKRSVLLSVGWQIEIVKKDTHLTWKGLGHPEPKHRREKGLLMIVYVCLFAHAWQNYTTDFQYLELLVT